MEERAVKRGFGWFIVLVLPLVLILGVVPCAAEGTHNLQALIDKTDNGGVIPIGNLELSNFVPEMTYAYGDASISEPDPKNIFVEPFDEGTLKPGLRFILNGELSVSMPSQTSGRILSISYKVTHIGGGFIGGKNLILDPLTAISGDDAYVNILEEIRNEQTEVIGSVLHELKDTEVRESSSITLETPQAVLLPVITVSSSAPASGEASIDSFEQIFTLTSATGAPIADAGPDQAVLDQVSLDGSGSSPTDADYQWELYQKGEDGWKPFASASGVQVEFTNLVYGIYEARLTVTKGELSAVDTALIAAAGASSGGGTEPGTPAELNLWDFTLKKYKFCKWSSARLLGTFNLPDDVEFHRGDDLVGKVTIQLNRAGEPVVVMSDDIKLRVSNWGYKLEISKH